MINADKLISQRQQKSHQENIDFFFYYLKKEKYAKYCSTYKYTLYNNFRFKEERSMGLLKSTTVMIQLITS